MTVMLYLMNVSIILAKYVPVQIKENLSETDEE